jgi:hypothetical protein
MVCADVVHQSSMSVAARRSFLTWRRYLASDRQSEWATPARRSLKFCEMQINLIASA